VHDLRLGDLVATGMMATVPPGVLGRGAVTGVWVSAAFLVGAVVVVLVIATR